MSLPYKSCIGVACVEDVAECLGLLFAFRAGSVAFHDNFGW